MNSTSGTLVPSKSDGSLSRLDISKLVLTLTDSPKELPPPETLKFGATFTDHMAIATFNPSKGWSAPEIKPYSPISLDPASSCLQYSSTCFEGMKAYHGVDGSVRLYRPDMNMRRLERSAQRLALPAFDGDDVLELIKRLVMVDKRWIPSSSGYSLYIRPTVIGTRSELSVSASDHAILFIIMSPSGPYFPQGLRPVSLLAVGENVRAWPGGTGSHKVGGNYSPGFLPQQIASSQGYDQVLWLFGNDAQVTEAGGMNFVVIIKQEGCDDYDFITAPLDGTILPGVTRSSCLSLAGDPSFQQATSLRLRTVERVYSMQDLTEWFTQGRLLEALCIGTAAIVAAVNKIAFEGKVITLPEHEAGLGPVGMALREKILAIQEGRDEYQGWSVTISE
ncbi:aminotransferase [Scleroderma citrinum]